MSDVNDCALLCGELAKWPTKRRMASISRAAGLRVDVGNYAIRVLDCDHFVIQEYGGDLGDPRFDADADSVEELMRDAKLVSDALAASAIRHRFEIYAPDQRLAGYLHYDWPAPAGDLQP